VPRILRLGLNQPAPDRIAGELHAVTHPELLEHVRPVAFHGLLADDEQLGDLARGMALGHELHDLALARRQRVLGQIPALAGRLQEVADQPPHGVRIEERLAAHGGSARLDQVAIGDRLQDVPGGARAQCLEQVLLVVVHREDQGA
jgi:hypothetical protein